MSRATRLELVAVAGGLALWSYVGWDGALWDARLQLVLHAGAIAVAGIVLLMAWRGRELPRTGIDLPLLALLLAFGVATLLAQNHGLALRALSAILATTAMLPAALLLVRHRTATTALIVTVPILLLSAGTLVTMLWRRAEWFVVGGGGLPPVRLGHEGTPFGSVAVPPFVILGALPLTLLIAEPRVRRWLQIGLVGVGVPMTLLSGSRSSWVAIAVAAAVFLGPGLRHVRLPRRWTAATVGVVGAAALGVALAVAFVAPRALAVGSLIYRGFLWRDTIAAWSAQPLTGIGPGTMPWARQAAAPAFSFPVRQPHSHDVLLGILGDAGLLGLAAALALLLTFVVVAGPWRTRTAAGRAAFAVLAGFAAAHLFEDLTFLPNFNVLVLLLAAVALTDAGAVRWGRLAAPPLLRVAAAVGAAALLLVTLLGDAAAVDYRFGADAADAQDWALSKAWFEQATTLDPWHPSGPKSLTVAADMAGDEVTARRAAQRAVELNPGDGASWTNLAILCLKAGDGPCAEAAARRATETALIGGRELANAALVFERLGETAAADDAYRRSLLTNVATSSSVPWPRAVDVGRELPPEIDSVVGSINLIVARAAFGLPVEPDRFSSSTARALAAAVAGDRATAEDALHEAERTENENTTTWDVAVVLLRHWGEPYDHALAVDRALRGSPLADRPPTVGGLTFDIASFRIYPRDELVHDATHLLPPQPWPWLLETVLPPG